MVRGFKCNRRGIRYVATNHGEFYSEQFEVLPINDRSVDEVDQRAITQC
jgi:hypothetical protein